MQAPTYQNITGGDFLVHKNPQTLRRMKSGTVRVPASYTGFSNLQDAAGYPVTKISDRKYELLLAGSEFACDGFLIQGPTIVGKTGGYETQMSYPYLILDSIDTAQAVCNENQIPNDLNGIPFDIGKLKGTKPFIKWVTNPQVASIPAEIGDLPLRYDPVLYAPWPQKHPEVLITNGARSFNGVDQFFNHVSVPELTADQSFWISAWINTSIIVGSKGIAGKWSAGGLEYLLYLAEGIPAFLVTTTSGSRTAIGTVLTAGTWNHILAVYGAENRRLKLYQNVVSTSEGSVDPIVVGTVDFRVGVHSASSYFTGNLSQVAFGKPTVPIAEIEQDIIETLWNNGNGSSVADISDPLLDIWGCRLTRWELNERDGNALTVEGAYDLTDNNGVGEANGNPTQYAVNSNAKNTFYKEAQASISNPHSEAALSSDKDLDITGHLKGSTAIGQRWKYNSPNGSHNGINLDTSLVGNNAGMKGFVDVDKSYKENGITFNGTTDYSIAPANVTQEPATTGKMTWFAKVFRPDAIYTGSDFTILQKNDGGAGTSRYKKLYLAQNTGLLRFGVYNGANVFISSTVIPIGVEVTVGVTVDNAGVGQLYINGVGQGESSTVGWLLEATKPLYIGSSVSVTVATHFWRGNINGILMYDVIKTPAEMAALHAGAVDTVGLVGKYTFEDPQRSVANAGPIAIEHTAANADYVECDGLIPKVSSDTQGTIMGWFKGIDNGLQQMLFSVSRNVDGTLTELQVGYDNIAGNDYIYITMKIDGGVLFDGDTDDLTVTPGIYYHLALVQDGVEPKIYINSVEVTINWNFSEDTTKWMKALLLDAVAEADSISFGTLRTSVTPVLSANGSQSSWKYYSSALSLANIQADYAGNDVAFNRTVKYPLNDGANNTGTLLPAGEENDSWAWDNTLERWIWKGDGVGKYINVEAGPQVVNWKEATIFGWVNFEDGVTGNSYLYTETSSTDASPIISLRITDGGLFGIFVRDDADVINTVDSSKVTDGWHFGLGTIDINRYVEMFVDDSLIGEDSTPSLGAMTVDTASIGALIYASTNVYANDKLRGVGVVPRIVSAAERTQIMAGTYPSDAIVWELDDGPNLTGQLLPADNTQDQQWSSDTTEQDWGWRGNGSTFYINNLRTIGSDDYSYYWESDFYQLDGGVQKVNGVPQAFTPHFYDDGSILQLGKSDATTFLEGVMAQFKALARGTNYTLDEGPSGQTVITGGSINRWLDLSSERNDIIAVAPSQRPVKAADGALIFDGVDDAMRTIRKVMLASGNEVTAFIVGERTSAVVGRQNFIEQTSNYSIDSGFALKTNTISELRGAVFGISLITGKNILNIKTLETLRYGSSELTVWDGLEIVNTRTGSGVVADDYVYVATRNLLSDFLGGKIYAIGIYKTALPDAEVKQLQEWLIRELGI